MRQIELDEWIPLFRRHSDDPGVLYFWETDRPPYDERSGHFHQVPTFVICLTGVARVTGRHTAVDLRAGDMIALEPGAWHCHEGLVGRSMTLHIGFMALQADILVECRDRKRYWKVPFNPTRNLVEGMMVAGSADHRRSCTRSFLRTFARQRVDDLDICSESIWPMISGLWRMAFDETVSVSDFLRKSGLSRAQSYRRFTAVYGVGPARAVDITRLELARWLLFKRFRVGDVARVSGYPTAKAFAKRWTAQFGRSPRHFLGRLALLPERGFEGR